MSTAIDSKVRSIVIDRARCLGNSKTDFKTLCSDLIADYLVTKKGSIDALVAGTFLSSNTLERLRTLKESQTGRAYRPCDDTLERVFRFFNVEFSCKVVKISAANRNKPKPEYRGS